ncbi:alpha-L RNA-binding motif-containing protein [Violaceomyces palustris]|uniref:Alpha-L RNA-binding motif-containing protein n=1 Tax=Violaceomyces palustris TaxID=1673888 RepID=A0ACD0NP27_9BASI|nr:alpha-L RNA-binding motif-containing protein [Violaceomyces palustris]
MRKAKVFSHETIMPRMSWSPKNLYNLIARSTVPFHMSQTSFTKTSLTMYQQRWRSKRFLRGYHGDWIPEKRFKRWFLPTDLPRFLPPSPASSSSSSSSSVRRRSSARKGGIIDMALTSRKTLDGGKLTKTERMPTASLFMRDVERRLDVVTFRCCFARSAYEARALVVQGKVKLNGVKTTDPNVLLRPGDLISVEPSAIPMLSRELAKKALAAKAKDSQLEEVGNEALAVELAEEVKEDAQAASSSEEGSGAKKVVEQEGREESCEEAAVEASSSSTESSEGEEGEKKSKGKNKGTGGRKEKVLPPGVLPFTLPPFAAPFLFIPPHLETSFTTCSAIYIRHPTIVPHKSRPVQEGGERSDEPKLTYRTDIASPYPAGGELYSMAWELYARNSPRVRAGARRKKVEGEVGRNGFLSARSKDDDRKRVAQRRGWGRIKPVRGWNPDVTTSKQNHLSRST